jgi:hypothetical protein
MPNETFKIGIDVGGTFTDLFVWSSSGAVSSFKVLSTPQDPSIGVIDGLAAIAEARSMPLPELASRVSTIVHGTTVTTNAVLTRGGARTGLLTTDGVRDALEMRRGIRERQYDNHFPNAVPLVPRHRRRPIRERMGASGQEMAPLDLDGVRAEARRLKAESVQSVAICFLNAFANPAHERAAAELVRAEPFRFVLIGEGQLSAELRGEIAARGLTNVEWLGELPAAELRTHTLAADVCLGVFGGSEKAARVVPNKVYDGLACGRPVVTADSDGAREWLRDGESALLTPAGDAVALAAALRRLLDERERARLGEGALALYRRAFTPAAVAGELLAGLERA